MGDKLNGRQPQLRMTSMLRNNLLLAFIFMASQINYYGLYFKFLTEHVVLVYHSVQQAYLHYKNFKKSQSWRQALPEVFFPRHE